jgi:hypothetical protein
LTDITATRYFSNRPLTCPRTETVRKLAELVDKYKVIHVRGTPASGKSTLAQLLKEHYWDKKELALVVPNWATASGSAISYLIRHREESGFGRVTLNDFYSQNIVFIIDEAQSSYHDATLWGDVLKFISDQGSQVRICLFSSHGSPSTGTDELPNYITPVKLAPEQRVSITILPAPMAPDIGLFYTKEEFNDAVHRICSSQMEPFSLESSASEYLFAITSGHPGAVSGLLQYIYQAGGTLIANIPQRLITTGISGANEVEKHPGDEGPYCAGIRRRAAPFPNARRTSYRSIVSLAKASYHTCSQYA